MKNNPGKSLRIVKIIGGIGNQMFQYAFAKELEKREQSSVLLDLSSFSKYHLHNGYDLERAFGIVPKAATIKDIKRLATIPTNVFSRLRRKYFTKKTHFIDKYFGYYPEVFEKKGDFYYDGYWQSEKYFSSIKKEIPEIFSFKEISEKNKETIAKAKTPTLSIHVRRGDYLLSENLNICGKNYYNSAILQALKDTDAKTIFVFSDDLLWCKENLDFKIDAQFIDYNTGYESWQDMALMSLCNHNIISNSSFSWWAAYLNTHKEKKIYAPSIWNMRQVKNTDPYYSFNFDDIIPASWIKVDNGI